MEFELKSLAPDSIAKALQKVERYRLLNEPAEAESICLDVLRVDPDNQDALVTLILSYTDQFPDGAARPAAAAEKAAARLTDAYKRNYYSGIIHERRGKAVLKQDRPGAGRSAQEWLRDAMRCYEKAEAIRPEENDEALLRWNTCARLLARHGNLAPKVEGPVDPSLE